MTKTEYTIRRRRAYLERSHTSEPVWTAEELMNVVASASHDDGELLFKTDDKDKALEELKKYYSDAWITAGMVGYQLDLEVVDLEEIEYEWDEDTNEWYESDYSIYDTASFGSDKYYANTYNGERD